MKVKCLKSNRKLVKGLVYDTDHFELNPAVTGWFAGRINIIGYGRYQCSNFTTTDGKELPKISYNNTVKDTNDQCISSIKKGDLIVCKSDSYAYLVNGGKYRIMDVLIEKTSRVSNYQSGKIKLEGYTRWLQWSTWKFRKLSKQESREIALSQIFDKEENFSVEFKRKFDLVDTAEDKNKVLIETLAKSILDGNRHHFDIIDWGIDKNSKTYNLKREDFKHLLNKPLSEILNYCEKK